MTPAELKAMVEHHIGTPVRKIMTIEGKPVRKTGACLIMDDVQGYEGLGILKSDNSTFEWRFAMRENGWEFETEPGQA